MFDVVLAESMQFAPANFKICHCHCFVTR